MQIHGVWIFAAVLRLMNNTGFIILHRQIVDSEIFYKPSDWLKIWIYILQKVNFKESYFQRGENMFNMQSIANDCGCSYNTVDKFLQWARKSEMLATRKTTRGIVILVLNYAKYQDNEFLESDTKSETEAKQKRNRSETIKEQCNNETMKQSIITNVIIETQKKENLEKTPKEIAIDFFTDADKREAIAKAYATKSNIELQKVRAEFQNFVDYWTELNGTGKKERWQLQKTFDVKRRLLTWFNNCGKFNFNSTSSTKNTYVTI